ncbi:MAG: hypothetical protein N2595_05520 [bacterium]|nr:hypothetical protein [bacterium]
MKTQLELQRTEWREVRNLAQQYRATTNELERTAIQQQLRAKLTAIFETRQALRRKELERLAQRIEELKNAVESREHNKDILIEQQLKAVIGGCGTTDW